MGRTCVKVVKS